MATTTLNQIDEIVDSYLLENEEDDSILKDYYHFILASELD